MPRFLEPCAEVVVNKFSLETRFKLTQSLPYLKSLYLNLKSVEFGENEVEINGTLHKMGVYREYPEGVPIPEEHRDDNARGGTSKDLGEDGARIWNTTFLPGDVALIPRDMWGDGRSEPPEEKPQFQRLLQYTIRKKNGDEQIERFVYNKSLHEAFKYLTIKLFGGSTYSIAVKNFTIKWGLRVLPLPVGVSFVVENLKLGSCRYLASSPLVKMFTQNRIAQIIDVDFGRGNVGIREDFAFFELCRTVVLRDYQDEEGRLANIMKLKNPEIIILNPTKRFSNQFVEIIRDRTKNCPLIGQKFTLEHIHDGYVAHVLNKIEAEFKSKPAVNTSLFLDIENEPDLHLKVSCTSGHWQTWRLSERVTIEAKKKSRKRMMDLYE